MVVAAMVICFHRSLFTSKHGHYFVHSIGSTSLFPLMSGLKSDAPLFTLRDSPSSTSLSGWRNSGRQSD
ncbi:hypothetical protein I6J67_14235 [Bacteroides cellulosilyticus]|nr:hypothetical protein [Bacteroides cellulosilyticus]